MSKEETIKNLRDRWLNSNEGLFCGQYLELCWDAAIEAAAESADCVIPYLTQVDKQSILDLKFNK